MDNIIKGISEEEWNKNFGGFFKSIHELCSHTYICDFNWLKRFKTLRNFDVLNKDIFEKNYKFTETIFGNINEYVLMRPELDRIIIEFINELQDDDLEKILVYTDSEGNKNEKIMESLLMHVFNHETHHRGMISLYLEMLGKENDFSGSMYKIEI
jgi:uncharacterized damage-inducible protein DinB